MIVFELRSFVFLDDDFARPNCHSYKYAVAVNQPFPAAGLLDDVAYWPIASFRGGAAIQSLSERSEHSASRAYGTRIYEYAPIIWRVPFRRFVQLVALRKRSLRHIAVRSSCRGCIAAPMDMFSGTDWRRSDIAMRTRSTAFLAPSLSIM